MPVPDLVVYVRVIERPNGALRLSLRHRLGRRLRRLLRRQQTIAKSPGQLRGDPHVSEPAG
jgi:hypothetical protein